jgi:hypothetical protein
LRVEGRRALLVLISSETVKGAQIPAISSHVLFSLLAVT